MRIYCENCKLWDEDRHNASTTPDDAGCTYVQRTDMEQPIRPTIVYGNHRYLNKDGDCEHYANKQEGLGILAGLPMPDNSGMEDGDES